MFLAVLIAGYIIADAILFVHGYKSYIFYARTEQEKKVRKALFDSKNIEWDSKK